MNERIRLALAILTGRRTVIEVREHIGGEWVTLVAPSYDHAQDFISHFLDTPEGPDPDITTRSIHIYEGGA